MPGSVATRDLFPVRPLEALEAGGALRVGVALPDAGLEGPYRTVVVAPREPDDNITSKYENK